MASITPTDRLPALPSLSPIEDMRKHPVESTLKRWLLLDGSRWVVAALLLAVIFTVLLGFGRGGLVSVREGGPTTLAFSALVAGNLTLVTIVISISQLILSWELGSLHDLRRRKVGVREFRHEVEESAGLTVSPAEPTEFLRVLLVTIQERADAIAETVDETRAEREDGSDERPGDERLRERVREYTTTVTEYVDQATDILEIAEFGTFNALSAMLNYNDAWQIHAARRLQREYETTLPEETTEEFDDLVEVLEYFSVARQYFKTQYMEQELARLSRVLFYVGIPALVISVLTMLAYAAGPGATLPVTYRLVVVSAAATVAMAPLAVLFAYVLRISTVVSRSPSIESFITGHEQRVKQRSAE